jgi:hypothetical protein
VDCHGELGQLLRPLASALLLEAAVLLDQPPSEPDLPAGDTHYPARNTDGLRRAERTRSSPNGTKDSKCLPVSGDSADCQRSVRKVYWPRALPCPDSLDPALLCKRWPVVKSELDVFREPH